MSARQAVAVAVLVALGGVVAVAPAVGIVGTDAGQTDQPQENATADGNTTSLGAQLSSFMQTSSAEANGSVDTGMWSAKYNDTDSEQRPEEIERRSRTLERRLERLENRMADLEAERENGSTDAAYVARASRLAGEIESLKTAINETDDAATEAGVNDTRLDELRNRANNASGQEVARMARNLTVVRAGQRGPPDEAGAEGEGDRQGQAGPPATPGSGGNQSSAAGESQGQGVSDAEGAENGQENAGTTDRASNGNGADDSGAGSENSSRTAGEGATGGDDKGGGPNSAGEGGQDGGNPGEGGPPDR